MKKVIIFIGIVILGIILVVFLSMGGVRTNIHLMNYEVSEDGRTMTIKVNHSGSAGYIRDMKQKNENANCYLTFYSTFGINLKWGAKDTFKVGLEPNIDAIYFFNGDEGYNKILEKDKETGEWNIVGNRNVMNDKELESESKDIINVNDYWSLQEIEYAARGDESDLISENNFLKEIEILNDLKVSRQLKVYTAEYEGQKGEEYSKFQENLVTYRFNDNREFYVELRFSENEILDIWKENENVTFKDSIIQNEKVHIFERDIPGDIPQRNCRAQFTIDGMNFIISTYNMSHEEFVKMVRTTIEEYKKIESIENSSSKIEDLIDGIDIVISADKQRVAYRKNSSSLYIANIDGSNEKLLLESINKGESTETTGYIPQKFIDNNKIVYTCIGWEDEKGCGIIEIDTGKNDYYENGNNVRYYYDEYEKKIMPIVVE